MTVFAWDASHFDGPLSVDTLKRARDEGIVLFTHKISEGAGYIDPLGVTNLTNAKLAGFEMLGGYHVVRSGPVGPQVANAVAAAPPWWQDFGGWCGQTDLEKWSYDAVPAATGVEFSRLWRDTMGRQVLLYASHGQYWDELVSWDGPLWNADYTSAPAAGFAAMYPGDDWMPLHKEWRGGWAAYSGREPDLLQYTSQSIIAGCATCDANAFRGSLSELKRLIAGQPIVGEHRMEFFKVAGQPAIYAAGGDYRRHIQSWPFVETMIEQHGGQLIELPDEMQLLDAVGPECPEDGGGSVDEAMVRRVVREELDKTHLPAVPGTLQG